jgi:DNA-binding LacI/PurR family transcriptional regulator
MFRAKPSACPTTRAAADPVPETSDVNGLGRSRPTMRHVAALAGVGIKTVSRVVNGEPNVSEAMIQRVQEAVQSLDYEPDVNAGNLRRLNRRTLTLGLLLGDFANPFSGAVQQGIEQKGWERDAAVLAASFGRDPDRGSAVVRTFTRRGVDGMILAAPAGNGLCFAPETGRTPVVFIGQAPPGTSADSVKSDDFTGAAAAA